MTKNDHIFNGAKGSPNILKGTENMDGIFPLPSHLGSTEKNHSIKICIKQTSSYLWLDN